MAKGAQQGIELATMFEVLCYLVSLPLRDGGLSIRGEEECRHECVGGFQRSRPGWFHVQKRTRCREQVREIFGSERTPALRAKLKRSCIARSCLMVMERRFRDWQPSACQALSRMSLWHQGNLI